MVRNYPAWARSLIDPASFEHEQTRLGQIWTLLGVVTDVANDGDWFRTILGGRSIFVQRFGEDLRGFENVCAHRFYPLRTQDKGNGPIRCGFHHWQYNKDGLAVGIPKSQELYGQSPRELDARLKPVELATCGILIFGRFPAAEKAETLEQFLGIGFNILQAMCDLKSTPYRLIANIAANWKLGFHISLDDYHIVAVHPDTFGKSGYL
jgi:phenylpropionate dioxygenase-like ring-hydroxylating dioxygenase large terminal subunit